MTIIFHHFSICFSSQKVEKTDLFAFFFRKIHTFNLPTIREKSKDLQDELPIVLEDRRSYQTYQEISGVCGRRKGIHSLSQWTLSFKSLKLHPTRIKCMGICGWEKCETLFSLPNMYVIICNPRKFKVWAIGQNVRKKIYTYPLKLGPEREKRSILEISKNRFMIQKKQKLQQKLPHP